jgi:hypothetical protein
VPAVESNLCALACRPGTASTVAPSLKRTNVDWSNDTEGIGVAAHVFVVGLSIPPARLVQPAPMIRP